MFVWFISSTVEEAGRFAWLEMFERSQDLFDIEIEDSLSIRVDLAVIGEFEKVLSRFRFLAVVGVWINWQALTY